MVAPMMIEATDAVGCGRIETQGPDAAVTNPEARRLLTRFAIGSGIELGPGHHPFKLPFGAADVKYVDRWEPDENRRLFRELGAEGAGFPQPDIVANLDTDRLSAVADGSQDFVIASHIIEHVAEPLGQLADIHRVLRGDGAALILLPDRRYTFDRMREPTALPHLIDEHRARITEVSDEHIEDFLRKTGSWNASWSADDRRRQFDLHRKRSIHVHCWSQDEFLPVIEYTIREMGMRWQLLDAIFIEDVEEGFEFGFALRKTTADADPAALTAHLRRSWQALRERSRRNRDERDQLRHGIEAERRLRRIQRLPGYATARAAYRLWRRMRVRR